jgi:protein tyrosine phosphatase (PTP) superfamily phosphohydrolase (DUF442 family)
MIFGSVLLLVFAVVLAGVQLLAQNSPTAPAPPKELVPATVHPLKADGIENFYQLTDRLFSGSQPEGDSAFAALKERGIKTIITVDGAKPDVESAKKFGIRYVHLPIGYDGVPTNQAVRMVKAAESLPGPVYVHCHHGLHRGPAGAAVICMAMEGWTWQQAEAWMKLAGTATNYLGLYKSVEQFHPPTKEALAKLPADFPEKSEISPLADVMIQIDGRFDNLKLIKKAGYAKPPSHPDLDPANEALLFHELFKELLRSPEMEKHDQAFRDKLTETEEAVHKLHLTMLITPFDAKKADATMQLITDSCAACHKAYRN